MSKERLRVAILTGNNSYAERYLVRLFRSEFDNVIVASTKPIKPVNHTIRYALGTVSRVLRLSAKNIFLKYKYSINPLITPKPKTDIEEVNINSEIVFRGLKAFCPDVICIYGTKKIEARILNLARNSINIHNGFVPYYRGVSSGYWVSLESNFSYLSYSIHKATSTIDAGEVCSSQPVPQYFFESLPDHQYRQSIISARAMLKTVKDIASGKDLSFKQPDLGTRNLRHKHKPTTFTSNAVQNFVSPNGKLYKLTTARTNRIENFFVKRLFTYRPKKIANGWFIVNYHAITLDDSFEGQGLPSILTSLRRFKEHLNFYSEEFDLISLSRGLTELKSGATKNTRYLSITFDDSLKLTNEVFELLTSKDVKPTLFLNSDPVIRQIPLSNHSKYLNWLFNTLKPADPYEIWAKSQYLGIGDIHRIVNQDLVELGSHTASHNRLDHLRINDLKTQITAAHKELEHHINKQIPYFAFPYGSLSDRTFLAEYEAMKISHHYFACEGGVNQNSVPGALLRIGVHNAPVTELINLLLRQYTR